MEQATAQADAIEDSTPQEADDSTSAQATGAADPVETTETETRAQSGSEAVDPDKAAFERLQAGEKPTDVRQNPTSVDPLPKPSSSGQQAPAKSKAKAGEQPDAYEGSDPKGIDALRRAQLLPDPADWAIMSESLKTRWYAHARNVLKMKGQISQQLGQAKKAESQQTNDFLDAEGEVDETAQDTSGTAGHPPQAAPPQPRGVRAQTQPAARSEAQGGLDEAFKALREFVGDDAAKPVQELIGRQQEEFAQKQQQMQTAYQQELARMAAQQQVLSRQLFLPQEQAGFKILQDELLGQEIDPATRKMIWEAANSLYHLSASAPKPLDWTQSIVGAGRSILRTDPKQQAQAEMIGRRKQALRATPAPGNGTTRPDRALSIDDRDKSAWDMLSAKRDARDVRAALS